LDKRHECRQPTSEELAAFMPFIQEEIKVVAPKVIIALGGTAAQELLKTEDDLVSMRGKFHDYSGVPVRVTYHPSYILHNEATSEKRKIWEDMLAVMDLLKMPVSDKQRGYFL
jgi:DNA polymerase